MYLWTRQRWLYFELHPRLHPDLGNFRRILQHCEIEHFSTIWLISLKEMFGSSREFCQWFIFGQKVPLNFGSHPDSEFTLAEVCALRRPVLFIIIIIYLPRTHINVKLLFHSVWYGCDSVSVFTVIEMKSETMPELTKWIHSRGRYSQSYPGSRWLQDPHHHSLHIYRRPTLRHLTSLVC